MRRFVYITIDRSNARPPLKFVEEEVADRPADVRPELLAVGLEDGPLRAPVDPSLDVGEVAPHVDVLPLRIRADRPCVPGLFSEGLLDELAELVRNRLPGT